MMIALAGVFTGSLSASTISGTFDTFGSFTATSNTISWTNGVVADQATIISNADLTGSFVGLGTTLVTIENLNNATEPVGGAGFAAQDFINFLSPLAASFPELSINYIAPGLGGSSGCSASPAAGQTCTPGGSPFTFQNGSLGGTSSLSFTFSGVTSDGKSSWTSVFTSQFNVPFQSVLAALATNGSFTDNYSTKYGRRYFQRAGARRVGAYGSGVVAHRSRSQAFPTQT